MKPRRKRVLDPAPMLPVTPDELIRTLISPMQAFDLVMLGQTADALANATRRIGKLNNDGLGHLTCSDILVALAELDLRAKQLANGMIERVRETSAALANAEAALDAAKRAHALAKAEVLVELGYGQKTETAPAGAANSLTSPRDQTAP